MRKISLERIGEYLKTAIEIVAEHGNEYPSRLLILEMQKKIKPDEYERSRSKTGAIRWVTKFRFWTICLVKGGFIKKQKKRWYLTNEGLKLLNKTPLELVKISNESYNEWEEKKEKSEKATTKAPLSIAETLKDISPTSRPVASSMKIKVDSIGFNDLLVNVEKCLIQISPFQRTFVWSASAIVELLDSIYKGYPIGSFIFWKTIKRLPHHRQIGGVDLSEKVQHGSLIDYIIDGQQRITSLYAAIKGAKIEDNYYKFYFDLSTGKFNYEKDLEEENNERLTLDYAQVQLPKIFVESTEYFRHIEQFPERHRNVLHDLFNRFKEYPFSIIYVRDEEENNDTTDNREDLEKIVKIFLRINDTGKKLSIVAKMVALCWEKGFDLRKKLNELLPESGELTEIREETILQIASVILNNKKCRTRNILEDTNIKELQENWYKITEAFNVTLDFLKDSLRIKNFRYLPFDSILVPLTYFHYKNHNPSNDQIDNLTEWFWKVSISNRYGSTVESKIEEDCNYFDQILDGKKIDFNYPIDWDTFKLRVIEQKYNFGNAFCKTILSLYSYFQPKNFKDNRDIDLSLNNFSNFSRRNLHHFFPRAYLRQIAYPREELIDSIANIAFAPAITNIEISSQAPSEYLKEFKRLNQEINETLKTHLIQDVKEFGLLDNNYELFLNKRAEKIENEFRFLLGLTSRTERLLEEQPTVPIDLFEIKMRNLINISLINEYGEDYWEESIPEDIRNVVDRKIKHDINLHPYNQQKYLRCEERLNFLDIMDYLKTIMVNWTLFKNIFESKSELEKHFLNLNNYRNSIKHAKEIDIVDKKAGEAAVMWFNKVFEGIEDNNQNLTRG